MGEEFAARTPFLFFCDFGPELAAGGARRPARASSRASRASRRRGARRAFPTRTPRRLSRVASSTGASAARAARDWLALYRELLALRREHIVPRLAGMRAHAGALSRARRTARSRATGRCGDGARCICAPTSRADQRPRCARRAGELVCTASRGAARGAAPLPARCRRAAADAWMRPRRARRGRPALDALCRALRHRARLPRHLGHAARRVATRRCARCLRRWASTPRTRSRRALAARERSARWRTCCRRSRSSRATRPCRLRVAAAAPRASGALRLALVDENGGRARGAFEPCDLHELAATSSGDALRRARASDCRATLPPGYHRLAHRRPATRDDALAHRRARALLSPAALADGGARLGPARAALRRCAPQRNWGIGDFTDLRDARRRSGGARGAASSASIRCTRSFRTTRAREPVQPVVAALFLNALYLDVEAVADFARMRRRRARASRPRAVPGRAGALRASGAGRLRRRRRAPSAQLLELLYAHFRERHLRARRRARARAFRRFRARRRRARCASMRCSRRCRSISTAQDPAVWGWPAWPEAYRDPDAPRGRARSRDEHAERVELLRVPAMAGRRCSSQRAARALRRARACGVGLYHGSRGLGRPRRRRSVGATRTCYALGASVGAPPDEFNLKGQDWGLPPLRARSACAPRATRRSSRRCAPTCAHAGALRIDHVMGLTRLYWIPPGARRARRRLRALSRSTTCSRILALESQRHRCMVIGEDLGTVPDEVRDALRARRRAVVPPAVFRARRRRRLQARPATIRATRWSRSARTISPTLAGCWTATTSQRAARSASSRRDELREQQRARARAGARAPAAALERAELLRRRRASTRRRADDAGARARRCTPISRARPRAHDGAARGRARRGRAGQPARHRSTSIPTGGASCRSTLEELARDARFAALRAGARAQRGRAPRRRARARRRRRRRRIPRATYRAAAAPRLHASTTRRALVPYLARARHQPRLLLAVPARAARQHARLRHRRPRRAQPRDRHARGLRALRRGAARARHGPDRSTSCPTTWASWAPTTRGGWTCWRTGRPRAYADFFDIDWQPANADARRQGAGAGARRPVRRRARARRARAARSTRDAGELQRALLRAPLPDRPARVSAHPGRAAARSQPATTHAARRARERSRRASATCRRATSRAPSAGRARSATRTLHKRAARAARAPSTPAIARARSTRARAARSTARRRPASFDALHALLEAQAYRLAYWRVAADEINYRRFFDINDLAALRMENEARVRGDAPLRARARRASGKVDGLRIDHPDGLYDPARTSSGCRQRYAQRAGMRSRRRRRAAARPLYVVVEKIVAAHEELPRDWAVHGTTGYRFANVVNGLLVDHAAASAHRRASTRDFTGDAHDFDELVYDGKRAIMRAALAARARRCSRPSSLRIAQRRPPHARLHAQHAAPRAGRGRRLLPGLPHLHRRRAARRRTGATSTGRSRRRGARSRAADATRLRLRARACCSAERRPTRAPSCGERVRDFAMRFQQFTAPVDGQGRRGHGVLPLQPARVAERRRRRSRRSSA